MKMISMKLARVAVVAMFGVCAVAANAAPAPEPADAIVVANDGYLTVRDSGHEEEIPPRVCPPGVGSFGEKCFISGKGLLDSDTEVQPVTVQKALDLAYGPGKTKVVAIAPHGFQSTVIFYRLTSTVR